MFIKCSNNPRQLWKLINSKLGNKANKYNEIDYITDEFNNKIERHNEIADNFNEFFCKIGPKLSEKIKSTDRLHILNASYNRNSLFIRPTNTIEIKRIINNMKDKSGGIDGIHMKSLKAVSEHILMPLMYVFNLCIEKSTWPNALKNAEVVPIFKAGNKHIPTNYRPISLISNIAKIFEKIIHCRIYDFVTKHNILSENQFGFRKNLGTKDALSHFTNIIYNNLDKSKPIIATFLDLAKAFDTVDHKILLNKLYCYGIRGCGLDLLKSYLHNRQQKVRINKTKSEYCNVTTGVPQGTILGPLLFLLYVNDLMDSMSSDTLIAYADDTVILSVEKTWELAENSMNKYLKHVASWLAYNKLSLNISKTVFITFGNYCDSVPENICLRIDNEELRRIENYKYLGLNIDCCMRWDKHIEYITNKTKYLLYVLSKFSRLMETDILIMLYYTLFHSIATYGIIAWGGAYKNSLNLLQRLQTRLLKIVSKYTFLINNYPLTLEQSFAYEAILYHHAKLRDIYEQRNTNTRNKSIPLPKITKSISNKNSYVVAIRIFNKLPSELKMSSTSKSLFKTKLKSWIKENYMSY